MQESSTFRGGERGRDGGGRLKKRGSRESEEEEEGEEGGMKGRKVKRRGEYVVKWDIVIGEQQVHKEDILPWREIQTPTKADKVEESSSFLKVTW